MPYEQALNGPQLLRVTVEAGGRTADGDDALSSFSRRFGSTPPATADSWRTTRRHARPR